MNQYISSSIFLNLVTHQRFIPFKHYFKYSLTSLYVDYDELKFLDKKVKLFSLNKFNIFSFYEKDHGYRDHRSLKIFVKDILKKIQLNIKK